MQRNSFFVVYIGEASKISKEVRNLDDNMILDLYWKRSESAIDETAAKYGRYCTTIAMNILKNIEDAEECVNDTYLKAWNAIPPGRPAMFSAFLGKITRNLSLNKYKEQHAQKRGGNKITLILNELEGCIPSSHSAEIEYESTIIISTINDFLYSLDSEYRIIFVRRYWYMDTIQSIAQRFEISQSKVKSMLFRTRKKLKIYLEKEGVVL